MVSFPRFLKLFRLYPRVLSFQFSAILALSFLLLIAQPALCVTGTVAWDPGSDTPVAGYRLYYGNSTGDYGGPIDVGNTLSL